MDDALRMLRLDELRRRSDGAGIRIGLIDGPVESSHPALTGALIEVIGSTGPPRCAVASGYACQHGTSIAAILVGQWVGGVNGIAPRATLVSRPLFGEHVAPGSVPHAAPEMLAQALIETVDAGAQVINLSVSVSSPEPRGRSLLASACDHAARRGVIVVAATGNDARVGPLPLLDHPWPIPVAACTLDGRLDMRSNLSPTIGRRGLAAPGIAHTAIPASGLATVRGTSVASAFVSGIAALLLAIYPQRGAVGVRRALLSAAPRSRTIIPPTVDPLRSASLLGMR